MLQLKRRILLYSIILMTKNSNIYALMVSLVLLTACSGDDFWETFDHTVDGTIDLSVGVESAVAQQTLTRTGESTEGYYAMKKGTQVRLRVDGYWKRKTPSLISNTKTCYTKAGVYGINNVEFAQGDTLYWDDYGIGDPSNVDDNDGVHYKNKGLAILGVAVDGMDSAPEIKDTSEWRSLSWPLATDGNNVLDKDIIVSNNLTAYKFAEKDNDDAKKIIFTHPLSKITFNITAGDGWASGFENDPVLTLSDANGTGYAYVNGNVSISSGTATKEDGLSSVIAGTTSESSDKKNYIKQALVYPGTKFGEDDNAVIAVLNADDNIYYIKAAAIRKAMLEKGSAKDCPTLPGYNYVINITVKKVGVSLTATVTNWTEITSKADADIQFDADVTTVGGNDNNLKDGDSFAMWMAKDGDDFATDTTTTAFYSTSTKKFTNKTAIYWPNGTTKYNFRALAKHTSEHLLDSVITTKVKQGTDLLWGTSGATAIAPRTGDVPLMFKHAMSNVIVTLETTTGDAEVNLTKAKVTLANLNTEGTINIADGVITPQTPFEKAFTGEVDDTEHKVSALMVPQEVNVEGMKLLVTIDDGTTNGTTYSLLLKDCKDKDGNYITKWVGGNQYSYTITLSKEAMKFRAVIKDWKPTNGSGDAMLDWD